MPDWYGSDPNSVFNSLTPAAVNPFDQFDAQDFSSLSPRYSGVYGQNAQVVQSAPQANAQGDNPFDQFDQPKSPSNTTGFLSGVSQGIDDIPNSVVELGARALDATGLTGHAYDSAKAAIDRAARAIHPSAYNGSTGAAIGRFVGQAGATMPLSGVRALPAVAQLPSLVRAIGNGAVQGALNGALTSSASDDPLGDRIGIQALAGGALPVAAKAAAAVLSPVVSPAVRSLLDKGVPLTIGQTLGDGARSFENKASSLPLIGEVIRSAQNRATQGMNRAAFNQALSPIGAQLPRNIPVGREAVDWTANQIGDAYDRALGGMTATPDAQFMSDLGKAVSDARNVLPDQHFNQFNKILDAQLAQKGGIGNSGATLDGDMIQSINSELGRHAAGYGSDPSFDNRNLGDALGKVRDAFRSMLGRSSPQNAAALKDADAAYARFVRVRNAAGSTGARDGVFSAPQLNNAVRAADRSSGKGAFSRGAALMQDLSDPAVSVLPSNVPDSGTAGRGLFAGMVLGGGAHYAAPATLIPALLTAGAYSAPGQAVLRAAVANRPQLARMAADLLRKKSGAVTPALSGAVDQLLDRRARSVPQY